MASKSLLLAALLLVVAIGLAPHGAAAGPAVMAMVSGIVPCSTGSSINVAAVPVFPNAAVKMVCDRSVVAGATADKGGVFTIKLDKGMLTLPMLTSLASNKCKVDVVTPLAACNVSLADATGTLTAPLQLVGAAGGSLVNDASLGGLIGLIVQIIGGLLGGLLNIVPSSFSFA